MYIIKKRMAGGEIPKKEKLDLLELGDTISVFPATTTTSVFPNSGSKAGDIDVVKSPVNLMNTTLYSSVSPLKQPSSVVGSPMMQNMHIEAPQNNKSAVSTSTFAPGADLLMKLSVTSISNPNSASQYEINDYKTRELQLHQKKQELNDFQSELDTLEPSSAELAKKRDKLELGKQLLIRIKADF